MPSSGGGGKKHFPRSGPRNGIGNPIGSATPPGFPSPTRQNNYVQPVQGSVKVPIPSRPAITEESSTHCMKSTLSTPFPAVNCSLPRLSADRSPLACSRRASRTVSTSGPSPVTLASCPKCSHLPPGRASARPIPGLPPPLRQGSAQPLTPRFGRQHPPVPPRLGAPRSTNTPISLPAGQTRFRHTYFRPPGPP